MGWNIFARKTEKEAVTGRLRAFGYSGGSVVSEDTAMKVSAFYRGVVYISTQVVKLPVVIKDTSREQVGSYLTPFLNCVVNDELLSAFNFN